MGSGLMFELLGPVRVWWDDVEIDVGTPQQRAVLGLLLLRAGALVPAEHLVSSIWGSTAPAAAAGMVRSYVSRLRRVLREIYSMPPIKSVAGGYVLAVDPATVDVARFEQAITAARRARQGGDVATEAAELRTALALWKGTPLAGIRGEYADLERTRLIELRMSAIEDLAAADLAAGHHAEVGPALVPIVLEQPLRERARELLMLALYRAGRQAEALAVFDETRQLLADELGLDPGPELQEMHRRILTSDPTLIAFHAVLVQPEPTEVTRPANVEAPRQLPARLPNFIGRSTELAEGLAYLQSSDPTVRVLGLVGPPGIGKTVLAIELANAVAGTFTDGLLFVDIGSTTDPLGALLRAAGVSARPSTPEEAVATWRSVTSSKNFLVIFDGVTDVAQVKPLIPPAGAVVITAQRRLIERSHARWITLKPFAAGETTALLESVVGPERVNADVTAVARLHELTSGVPEAVFLAGSRLAGRPDWTLDSMTKRFSAQALSLETRYEDCRAGHAAYDAAAGNLSAPLRRAFRLLALLGGPDISLAAAAAIIDRPHRETDYVLESLVDVHLLEPVGQYYRFLNPVRYYARTRALVDEGYTAAKDALVRVARFYAATLVNALNAIDPPANLLPMGFDGETFSTSMEAASWMEHHEEHLWDVLSQTKEVREAPSELLAGLFDRAQQSMTSALTEGGRHVVRPRLSLPGG